jgi:hypothetical protein
MNTAVTAISLASASAVASPSLSGIDEKEAEITALGDEFARLYERVRPLRAEADRREIQAKALAWQRVGRPDGNHETTEEFQRWMAEWKQTEIETGATEAWQVAEEIENIMDGLAKTIMSYPANSLSGVRAKTLVALHSNAHVWSQAFDDLDWDEKGTRSLIEAACKLTGVEVPPEEIDEDATTLERLADSLRGRTLAGISPERRAELEAYSEWLFNERRLLTIEMYGRDNDMERYVPATKAARFHFPSGSKSWDALPQPSTRVATILAAAGVDLSLTA